MNAGRTARERVRAELTREITDVARRQLATEGAAGLSLRAVAREMGMVSSAVYRYFPSRDDLLTALIIDGYNAIGAAVEQAEAACPRADYPGRWLTVCRAIRAWALANPHEYALVYGSPVPGYRAPERTIQPASRVATVVGRIISDACQAGALAQPETRPAEPETWHAAPETLHVAPQTWPAAPETWPGAPESFAGDAARLRDAILPGVPDSVAAGALASWAGVFGMVSFELFGQFENVVTDRDAFFDYAAGCLGRLAGLS